MIDVSIIIINYNTRELTTNCIRSIEENVKGVSFDIILVDNASDECDPNVFKDNFPAINLVISKTNLGFAGGNNLGIQHSKGNYLLLLNSDTILVNDAVSLTLQKMKSSAIQLATCQVLNLDNSIQPTASFFPSVKFSMLGFFGVIQLSRKLNLNFASYQYDYKTTHPVDWIWGCFFLFNKEVLQQFEGNRLPDDFFMYGEDMQWCYLLNKKGIKTWYVPDGIIYHLFSGNKISQDPEKNMGFKNHIIFLKKYYKPWRYHLIFFFDSLILATRFRFKHLIKKIHLYRSFK